MTIITPTQGSRKAINFSYPTPRETALGSPITLPTSEPGTPQISYMVLSADLPPIPAWFNPGFCGCVLASGYATSATTVYANVYLNSSLFTYLTITVSEGYYWTLQSNGIPCVAGDLIQMAIWAADESAADYRTQHFFANLWRARIGFVNNPMSNVTVQDLMFGPTLTAGNPQTRSYGGFVDLASPTTHFHISSNGSTYPVILSALWIEDEGVGGMIDEGYWRFDDNFGSGFTTYADPEYYPVYTQVLLPTVFSYRKLRLNMRGRVDYSD